MQWHSVTKQLADRSGSYTSKAIPQTVGRGQLPFCLRPVNDMHKGGTGCFTVGLFTRNKEDSLSVFFFFFCNAFKPAGRELIMNMHTVLHALCSCQTKRTGVMALV